MFLEGSGSVQIMTDPGGPKTCGSYGSVFRIHEILGWIRIRIRESMPLTTGSGAWIRIRSLDTDPAIFVIDLQYASKKLFFNTIFSAYYFLKVHLRHFSKIKSQQEPQNSKNQGFFLLFLHDDRRIRIQGRIRIHTSD